MTTTNTLRRFPPSMNQSKPFNRFRTILTARWTKFTGSVRKKHFKPTMVWRQSLLIQTNQLQNKIFHTEDDSRKTTDVFFLAFGIFGFGG
jgi:hypothetical protein